MHTCALVRLLSSTAVSSFCGRVRKRIRARASRRFGPGSGGSLTTSARGWSPSGRSEPRPPCRSWRRLRLLEAVTHATTSCRVRVAVEDVEVVEVAARRADDPTRLRSIRGGNAAREDVRRETILFAATYPERVAALALRSGCAAHDVGAGLSLGPDRGRSSQERRRARSPALRARVRGGGPVRTSWPGWDGGHPAIVDYLRWCAEPRAPLPALAADESRDRRAQHPAMRSASRRSSCTASRTPSMPVERARMDRRTNPGARLWSSRGTASPLRRRDGRHQRRARSDSLPRLWESGRWESLEPEFRARNGSASRTSSARASGLAELGESQLARAARPAPSRYVRLELARFRGVEVDTAGDGFFAALRGPARAIRCASAIVDGVERRWASSVAQQVCTRASARVVDGKVAGYRRPHGGARRLAGEPGRGARVAHGQGSRRRLRHRLRAERGVNELKGVPGDWELFAVDRVNA